MTSREVRVWFCTAWRRESGGCDSERKVWILEWQWAIMLDREGVVGGGNWGVVVVVEVVCGGVDVVGWLVVGDAAMGPLGVGGIESVMVIDCRVDRGRCMYIYGCKTREERRDEVEVVGVVLVSS